MTVRRDMEGIFLHSEHQVVSAFEVLKCIPASSGRGKASPLRPPQATNKRRVLCVTVKRVAGVAGLKPFLHVCKGKPGKYEVRKTLRLKTLKRLEAFHNSDPDQVGLLEITFVNRGLTGSENRFAFKAPDAAARAELLGILYTFCKSYEQRQPELVGIKKADLGVYADIGESDDDDDDEASTAATPDNHRAANLDNAVTLSCGRTEASRTTGGFESGSGSLQQPNSTAASVPQEESASRHHRFADSAERPLPAVGQGAQKLSNVDVDVEISNSIDKVHLDDAQLDSLLDAVAGGASSVKDFRARLTAEMAALQGADVHELLESSSAAKGIEAEISATLGFVDDLKDALGIFDIKFRHVKENMGVIEAWNNRLEAVAKNNRRLATTLESLIASLTLTPGNEETLAKSDFGLQSRQALVHAAWDLHRRITSLEGTGATGDAPGAPSNRGGREASTADRSVVSPPPSMADKVPPRLVQMSAVVDRQRRLHDLARNFLDKATDYLAFELQHLPSGTLTAASSHSAAHSATTRNRLNVPDHAALHDKISQLSSLLEVVVVMRPAAAEPMRRHYCGAVNGLVKKELTAVTKQLLRQVSEGGGVLPEPDLVSRASDSIRDIIIIAKHALSTRRTLERFHATPMKSIASGPVRTHAAGQHTHAESAAQKLTPEDAFDQFVGTFLPVLVQENDHAARFYALTAATPIATSQPTANVAANVLSGVSKIVIEFLDALVKPLKALASLHMLGTCLHWSNRLQGRSGTFPILELLRTCEASLQSTWDGLVAEKIAAVQKFDGSKSSMSAPGSAMRGLHVMPFVVNFEALASKIESAVGDWAQRDAPAATSRPEQASKAAAGQATKTSNVTQVAERTPSPLLLPVSPFQSEITPPSGEQSKRQPPSNPSINQGTNMPINKHSREIAATRWPGVYLRQLAEDFYDRLLKTMLGCIEAHAHADVKHSSRLRLENYAFLRLSLQKLPVSKSPVLQRVCSEAAAQRNAAMAAYVDQQLEYLKLDTVMALADHLTRLEEGLTPNAESSATAVESKSGRGSGAGISVASSLEAGEMRSIIVNAEIGLEKRLLAARQRMHKHFGASSPWLIDVVWEKLERRCAQGWELLERYASRLPEMQGIAIRPTSNELRQFFVLVKSAQPANA